MGITAKQKIVARLSESARPLPIHHLDIPGVSECSASARLREMQREGLVYSVPVPGTKYTAWALIPKELALPLALK